MRNILMLDVEGTLTSGVSTWHGLEYFERPNSDIFLKECQGLFDIIYLNTHVNEEDARKVMEKSFPSIRFEYYDYLALGEPYRKSNGFEQFKDDRLVMVDDCIDEKVAADIERLGFKYIKIKGWGCGERPFEGPKDDTELIRALSEIKEYLGK